MEAFQLVKLGIRDKKELAALLLRVGLGLVFLFGGLSKLGQLLDPALEPAMMAEYLGPSGYVNEFFAKFVFSKGISPWMFLTGLSAFEVVSGVLLVVGLAVRPISLVYGFLLWTFVMSLPVVTAPGVTVAVKTYTSPAMLVQARDIALSGLMFVLFNLGSGPLSLDQKYLAPPSLYRAANWDQLGVLLRLSLAFVFIVGGVFQGMDHIQSFSFSPWVLIPLGLLLASGIAPRYAGAAALGIVSWYMITKFNFDKSLLSNLNSVKREFALMGAATAMTLLGGGKVFSIRSVLGKETSEAAHVA